jgi:hypothetical protein
MIYPSIEAQKVPKSECLEKFCLLLLLLLLLLLFG